MMVRLDKKQQAAARRQLSSDSVWVICNDTLRKWQLEGKTALAPVEGFMSSQCLCDVIFGLSDIDEGIDYELDDLEDEVEGERSAEGRLQGKNDAMLIAVLAALQMQAMSKRCVGQDLRKAIMHIFERYGDHELFLPLVEQWTKKEEARWMEGKKTNLLDYELQEIKFDGGGVAEMKGFVDEYVRATLKLTEAEIRSNLLTLGFINMEYGHVFDEQLKKLFDKLDMNIKEVHNHFEAGSSNQVFNAEVNGNFEKK